MFSGCLVPADGIHRAGRPPPFPGHPNPGHALDRASINTPTLHLQPWVGLCAVEEERSEVEVSEGGLVAGEAETAQHPCVPPQRHHAPQQTAPDLAHPPEIEERARMRLTRDRENETANSYAHDR